MEAFGKGGFGQVYKVKDNKTGKYFAMKVQEKRLNKEGKEISASAEGGVHYEYYTMDELKKAAPIPVPVDNGVFTHKIEGEEKTFYYMTMDFLG